MGRTKTPSLHSVRRLRQLGIEHRLLAFDPAIHSATGAAESMGVDPGRVYKTLVVITEPDRGKPVLALLPGEASLDLKRLARHLGVRRARMAPHTEAERLTGLQTGGISPLALLDRGWPVLLDSSARAHDRLLISAGARGYDIEIAVDNLVRVTGAQVLHLAASGASRG